MLSQARWEAERILMANTFRAFQPFAENDLVGFRGHLQGPRTRRIYKVLLQASVNRYPQDAPAVYMQPHAEWHHWVRDGVDGGRLCYLPTERPWKPGRDTFLKVLLVAVDYLKVFD